MGFGAGTGAWAGCEVGVLWGTEFADVDALFGADELAGWTGTEEGMTEEEHAESEAGFAAGLGSGPAATFAGRPGPDCGFGMGVVGAVAGAGYAW